MEMRLVGLVGMARARGEVAVLAGGGGDHGGRCVGGGELVVARAEGSCGYGWSSSTKVDVARGLQMRKEMKGITVERRQVVLGCVEEDGHGWLGACAGWERATVDCEAPTDS